MKEKCCKNCNYYYELKDKALRLSICKRISINIESPEINGCRYWVSLSSRNVSLDEILGLVDKDWCDYFGKYGTKEIDYAYKDVCKGHINRGTKTCLLCKRISKKNGKS